MKMMLAFSSDLPIRLAVSESSFDFPARLTPHSTFMSGVRMTAASLFSALPGYS
jgi:hypothetical protein